MLSLGISVVLGLSAGAFATCSQALLGHNAALAQSGADQVKAKQAWKAGRQLMAKGDVAGAEQKYREALVLHDKAQYQLDLARALIPQKRLLEAIELLNQVVTTSEPNVNLAKAAAQKLLVKTEPDLSWIHIKVVGPEADEVSAMIDGQRVDVTGEVPFDPGEYTVSVEAEGYRPAEVTFTLEPGSHDEVRVDLFEKEKKEAPPAVEKDDDDGPSLIPPVLAFGVGAAGIGVGVAFGAIAFSDTNAIKDRCGGNVCPPEEEQALNDARLKGTISTAGFVAGGIGVATGVVLVLAMSGGDDETDGSDARITPVVGPGYLGASGTF